MSEADNSWRVDVGGASHEISVEHSTMTGKVVVRHDGQVVDEARLLMTKKELAFDVAGHQAFIALSLAYGGFAATSELRLDGHFVEPLRR